MASTTTHTRRDAALIYRARHDAAAHQELLEKYRNFFVYILKRTLPQYRRPPVSQYLGVMWEAFQEAVDDWDPRAEFTTYLSLVLRRAIYKQWHKDRLVKRHYARFEPLREPPSDRRWSRREHFAPESGDTFTPAWYTHALASAWWDRLPRRMRRIFALRQTTDRTSRDIGEEFGITTERVRQIVFRCRQVLRHMWEAAEASETSRSPAYWRARASINGL